MGGEKVGGGTHLHVPQGKGGTRVKRRSRGTQRVRSPGGLEDFSNILQQHDKFSRQTIYIEALLHSGCRITYSTPGRSTEPEGTWFDLTRFGVARCDSTFCRNSLIISAVFIPSRGVWELGHYPAASNIFSSWLSNRKRPARAVWKLETEARRRRAAAGGLSGQASGAWALCSRPRQRRGRRWNRRRRGRPYRRRGKRRVAVGWWLRAARRSA